MEKKFFDELTTEAEADVVAFGAPVGRKAAESIDRLCETSWYVWSYDHDKKRELVPWKIADVGNLEIKTYAELEKISDRVKKTVAAGRVSLMLGGGHLTTLYAFKPLIEKNAKLVIFDCHCDLQDEFLDDKMVELSFLEKDKTTAKLNDTTWLRRLCEQFDPKNIMLLGLRSGAAEEFEFAENSGITYFTACQIKNKLQTVKEKIKKFVGESDVYVSVDIDAFDPAYAPAVDQPEPGGISFGEFQEIVSSIEGKLIGTDLVAFRPIEGNEVTEFLGVRVIYEVLGLIKKRS